LRPRPARSTNLTSKLKDTNNVEKANLSFQRKAVQEFHSRQAAEAQKSHTAKTPPPALSSSATENGSHSIQTAAVNAETGSGDDMEDADEQPKRRMLVLKCFLAILSIVIAKKITPAPNTGSSSQPKRAFPIVVDGDTDEEDHRRVFLNLSFI
jgi:hypothetical protein